MPLPLPVVGVAADGDDDEDASASASERAAGGGDAKPLLEGEAMWARRSLVTLGLCATADESP